MVVSSEVEEHHRQVRKVCQMLSANGMTADIEDYVFEIPTARAAGFVFDIIINDLFGLTNIGVPR